MQFDTHFTVKKLLSAAFPLIVMMIFTSLYSVADGLFLSNFAGKEAFAAVNFIMPYLMFFPSTGFLFGSGGSALIAKRLGEKRDREADEIFTTLLGVSALTGLVLAILGLIFLRPVAELQGAEGALLQNSLLYGRIYLLGTPASVVQFEFESLYPASGKNKLGLWATVASGGLNIVLDAIFLGVFSWGIRGAAVATILSQWLGGLLPFFYYRSRRNTSLLHLVRCRPRIREMGRVCTNGASEMVNNISNSVVSLLYNVQLLRLAGDDGIAAYGVMMYINFLFTAVFWGYVSGAAPIVSYHYGAGNHRELKSLLRQSLLLLSSGSLLMFLLSVLLARPVSSIFVGYDPVLFQMTIRGFRLFSLSFLFAGLSIFGSSFFTALNNGLISAILSFSRVFLFQVPAVLLLPRFFELDGIWLSAAVAEFFTALMGGIFILAKRKKYHY